MKYIWQRRGGYEVSSKGDKRFSALNAVLPDGLSIEVHYQCRVFNQLLIMEVLSDYSRKPRPLGRG